MIMTISEKIKELEIKERNSIVSSIGAVRDVLCSSAPDEDHASVPGSEQRYAPIVTGDNRDKVGSKLMELIAKL